MPKVLLKLTIEQLEALEPVVRNRIESLEERNESDDAETIKVLREVHKEIERVTDKN